MAYFSSLDVNSKIIPNIEHIDQLKPDPEQVGSYEYIGSYFTRTYNILVQLEWQKPDLGSTFMDRPLLI